MGGSKPQKKDSNKIAVNAHQSTGKTAELKETSEQVKSNSVGEGSSDRSIDTDRRSYASALTLENIVSCIYPQNLAVHRCKESVGQNNGLHKTRVDAMDWTKGKYNAREKMHARNDIANITGPEEEQKCRDTYIAMEIDDAESKISDELFHKVILQLPPPTANLLVSPQRCAL
jgi:hypothetical protein